MNVASTALIWGDFSGSRGLLEEALRIASRLDDRVAQFYLLDALAYHSACTGLARTGAQLLGAADAVRAGGAQQQADRRGLFISERTVDSHERSILNKLGLNSRAQIAAWVTARGQSSE